MELTEKERIEQIEKNLGLLAGALEASTIEDDSNVAHLYGAICKRFIPDPTPEPTPFQKHMAEAWPDIRPGSREWVDRCKGWNAATGTAAYLPTRDGSPDSMVERDAILALKEPAV